jgi:hypothetical protein
MENGGRQLTIRLFQTWCRKEVRISNLESARSTAKRDPGEAIRSSWGRGMMEKRPAKRRARRY